jgi:hypothetical protein
MSEWQKQRDFADRELQAAEQSGVAVAIAFWRARAQYLSRPQPALVPEVSQ